MAQFASAYGLAELCWHPAAAREGCPDPTTNFSDLEAALRYYGELEGRPLYDMVRVRPDFPNLEEFDRNRDGCVDQDDIDNWNDTVSPMEEIANVLNKLDELEREALIEG